MQADRNIRLEDGLKATPENRQKTIDEFRGLSSKRVKQQREDYGSNQLIKRKRKGFWGKVLEGFADPIIKILLIALGINIFFLFQTADWFESIGIAAAVLVATVVSAISENGSEAAFEQLQEDAANIVCKVQRDGQLGEVSIDDIVVGDLVLLQSGDMIPADGFVLAGEVDVDQSALNGETKEAHKSADYARNGSFMDGRSLFRGAVVCGGECVMEVSTVGNKTFYGGLADAIQEETRESPMKVRLGKLAAQISKFGYIGAIIVALAYIFNTVFIDNQFDYQLIKTFLQSSSNLVAMGMNAVTLAVIIIVVAVPEGLPMMVTVVLSANMRRMLKDNVLVRKLVGIETAGSLNVLFTDKTGTLTQGKLEVCAFIEGNAAIGHDADIALNDTELERLMYTGISVNNSSILSKDGESRAIGGNATDRALLEHAMKHRALVPTLRKHKMIPFDSALKFSAIEVSGTYNLTFIKGAPEKILSACTHYYDRDGNPTPLPSTSSIEKSMKELTGNAIRLIAVATSENPINRGDSFENLTLVGLVGIRDRVRKEAISGVSEAQQAGIQVVMITGDGVDTARAVAREVGIIQSEKDLVYESKDIAQMDDDELMRKLPSIRVIARAIPSDKSRLVELAQQMDLVVGMTGDGVNDAPALKKADVGFAMGSGSEVAKEAGDIIILDDNIASISKAILYGRTIFKSIRKFIIFQLTVNVSAVALSIIGPLIGIDAPVTVMQMLWINMVMDTLAGLAYGGEPPLPKYMKEPPKKRNENIINRYMFTEIAFTGAYTILLCLAFLKVPALQNSILRKGYREIHFLTVFFAIFMFSAVFNSLNARTHSLNIMDHMSQNKTFILIMGAVTVIQIILLFVGGTLFRTAPPTFRELVGSLLLAATVIPVDMLRKWLTQKSKVSMST